MLAALAAGPLVDCPFDDHTARPQIFRVEKFQMMAQKNQALMQLKDEFGLELY